MPDSTENRRKLLAAELQRYFGETCAALTARGEAALVGLVPPVLQELTDRLQAFETLTTQVNRELATALAASAESAASAEPLLDRARASLEHLNEAAEAIMGRLDELRRHNHLSHQAWMRRALRAEG
jgi:hypothetical protein